VGRADEDRRVAGDRRRDAELSRLVDHALNSELDAEPDRSDVARLIECLPHRQPPEEAAVVVLWRPRRVAVHLHSERRVVDQVRERSSTLYGVGVNDRLERRPWLPQRLAHAVALIVVEVATTD